MRNNDRENIHTLINVLSSLVVLVVSAAVNFVLSPYIITNIGEEANGFVQLANNFVTYASLITIALNSMASRFVSLNYHKSNYNSANIYYSTAFFINIAVIIILGIIASFAINNLDSLLNLAGVDEIDVKLLFAFVFLSFFLSQLSSILSIFLFVMNKIYYSNFLSMISTILRAVLLYVLFTKLDAKMYFATLTSCITTFFIVISYVYLKKKSLCNINLSIRNFRLNAIKELFASGIWNAVNQCGNVLMTGMDLLFANWFINPIQMGVLAVSKTIPTYITQAVQSINSSILPGLLISFTKSDEDSIRYIKKMIKISSLIIVVPITVFLFYSYDFYSLWLPSMDAKQLAILSFLGIFSIIPLSGIQILYNVFTVKNKLKINSLSFLITGILNVFIVLFFVCYTDFGIYAIAGTSSILAIIRNIFVLIPYASILLKLKYYYFYKSIFVTLLCFCVTVSISFVIKLLFNIDGWLDIVILTISSGLISYVLNSILMFDKSEFKKITQFIKGRLNL